MPLDDTAEIVEMLQAERAEEHAQENDEQLDKTMSDPLTPGIFLCTQCAASCSLCCQCRPQHTSKIESFIANSAASRSVG